jgi:very-short-patch-repair endonuclease
VLNDKVKRLFQFLKEFAELRSKAVRDIDSYEAVLWLNDIPHESGCYCKVWDLTSPGVSTSEDRADNWVFIRKPKLKPAPELSDELRPWLIREQIQDSHRDDYPELRSEWTEVISESHSVTRKLQDHPDIEDFYLAYLEQWESWRNAERPRRKVQRVYSDLYAMYQKQQRLGEAYEVVLGIGYLTWATPAGYRVRRHLVTAPSSISFEPTRGVITVGPPGIQIPLSLEQDMFDPRDRLATAQEQAAYEPLKAAGDDAWDLHNVEAAITSWVHAASAKGEYETSLVPQNQCTEAPAARLAPAIILRRRTERGYVRFFQSVLDQLDTVDDVPVGVKRLVTIMDDAGLQPLEPSVLGGALPTQDANTYFPLPANDEQKQVLKALTTRQGVLVQGPPGTGKSHTIANVISHLLASGQRVLVTSHTARALRVLKEKLPKDILPLCVSLLGTDQSALKELEEAVEAITNRYEHWSEADNNALITRTEKDLSDARRQEAHISQQLRAIREIETYHHPRRFGSYEGTLSNIAEKLEQQQNELGWIKITPAETEDPPLTDSEAAELLASMREFDQRLLADLGLTAPCLCDLPKPNAFAALVQTERDTSAKFDAMRTHRQSPLAAAVESFPAGERIQLEGKVRNLIACFEALTQHRQPWAEKVAIDMLADHDRMWRELLDMTRQQLVKLRNLGDEILAAMVTGVAEHDATTALADVNDLLERFSSGKGLGWGPFRAGVVRRTRYIWDCVKINGRRCDNPEALKTLASWLETRKALESLKMEWIVVSAELKGTFRVQVAQYEDLCEPLEDAVELHDQLAATKSIFRNAHLPEPRWHEIDEIRQLRATLTAVRAEEEYESARHQIESVLATVNVSTRNAAVHPITEALKTAIKGRDTAAYQAAWDNLSAREEQQTAANRMRDLRGRLEVAAPALAEEFEQDLSSGVWEGRFGLFEAAWRWGQADAWLRRLTKPQAASDLERSLDETRNKIHRKTGELAAAKAWQHCFGPRGLGEYERQHLVAWSQAIRRIGKGTGKYAARHRHAAQEHMEECRRAIPAWVMPLYRVVESVRPGRDAFDVAIIDEASQSGPEAMLLLYLAKKIVVVGDDKQISPEFVGVHREDVELLREKYISDLPHKETLGVDYSLFDQADLRFGGRIRLREHFRCMPEIIQFSNNNYYRAEPLVPLRQYGFDRLEPVKTTHVFGGYRSGTGHNVVNELEAQSIADEIIRCCNDDRYRNKSMGVISLQGEAQAKFIESLLLERLGPEEMDKRELVCGDAYAFQGDERDVVFLSMVAATDTAGAIGVLSNAAAERRFNVAASRARDQMWLFHSVAPSDLSPQCQRYKLLRYCLSPHVQPAFVDRDVPEDRLVEPFGSLFEQRVYRRVVARGYRALPQYEVAGYRIDLVVEGMRGRMAVECDGDEWHGPDVYDRDMARQRQLERCGWTFWRVRGSSFHRDPDGSLEGLWDTLGKLGIFPRGDPRESSATTSTDQDDSVSSPNRSNDVTRTVHEDSESAPPIFKTNSEFSRDNKAARSAVRHGPTLAASEYRTWSVRSMPDPRIAPFREVIEGLIDIISTEGPMLAYRAYGIFAHAAGINRIGREIRSVFNEALERAIRMGRVAAQDEHKSTAPYHKIVRVVDTQPVLVRTLGNRTFEEIPPSEIAEVMRQLCSDTKLGTRDELYRSVLEQYGLKRLTSQIRAEMDRIFSKWELTV